MICLIWRFIVFVYYTMPMEFLEKLVSYFQDVIFKFKTNISNMYESGWVPTPFLTERPAI